jgi:hypothetical protein
MGLDRFANFLSKFINNDGIDRLNIENNIRKVIANHIIFDLNFLIYQEIIEIENEVNDILKIMISYKNSSNIDILYKLINEIIDKPYWKVNNKLLILLNNIETETIVNDFIKLLFSNIYNNNKLIDLIIYEKIIYNIKYYIDNIHYEEFIYSINIFYDGIPSFSKIIEQRKRRIKNYLEFHEKKILFKKYFDKLLTNNKDIKESLSKKYKTLSICNDIIITFDYLTWVTHRFSIDKSIGPSSIFISNLDIYISNNIQKYFPNKKINIFNSIENGEADLKIFKYIANKNISGDYCIHTTDSDLIHQMLVQQTYYKIMNLDINISLIKYIKNYNTIGYVQLLDANIIIKSIIDLYNTTNNIKINNYKIIWDLCLIFYLFGNDHIPPSLEIGPELSCDFFLKSHYQSIFLNNIVNIVDNNINIDLQNLLLLLIKINNTNKINITKIILQRFFKINYQLIIILTDNFNFNFNEILLFLEKFILYRTLQLSSEEQNNLNIYDIRKILLLKHKDNLNLYKHIDIFNFKDTNINILNNSIDIIENNIDYYEHEYMGLILYNKSIIITDDSYQDLYNYISDKIISELNKQYPTYYDHINLNSHMNILNIKDYNSDVNCYLRKIFHLVTTQFGDMKNYHTDNLTYYKYYYAPSINNIIIFLQKSNHDNITKIWEKNISDDNIFYNYFTYYNHHIFISPFIINYKNIPHYIKKFLIELNINNLWMYDINNFNYRDININEYFNKWNNLIKSYNNMLLYLPIQDIIY